MPPSNDARADAVKDPPVSRGIIAKRLALTLGFFLLSLAVLEVFYRYMHVPSLAEARYLFHAEANRARWEHLQANRSRLVTETDNPEPPNENIVHDSDESDQPPFDRVPSHYRIITNAESYRDDPFDRPFQPGQKRIVFLGSSGTFGHGVEREDRFVDRLRTMLPGIDAYNMGVLGCTSTCMADRIERAMQLRPDLVVIQATANDLNRTLLRTANARRTSSFGIRAAALVAHSRFFQTVAYWLHGDPYDRQSQEAIDAAEGVYHDSLVKIFSVCRQHRVKTVVVDIPFATGDRYGQNVVSACRAAPDVCLGVVSVDLSPPMNPRLALVGEAPAHPQANWVQETADLLRINRELVDPIFPMQDMFIDIVHPNKEGHQRIAAQLAAFLQTRWLANLLTSAAPVAGPAGGSPP